MQGPQRCLVWVEAFGYGAGVVLMASGRSWSHLEKPFLCLPLSPRVHPEKVIYAGQCSSMVSVKYGHEGGRYISPSLISLWFTTVPEAWEGRGGEGRGVGGGAREAMIFARKIYCTWFSPELFNILSFLLINHYVSSAFEYNILPWALW